MTQPFRSQSPVMDLSNAPQPNAKAKQPDRDANHLMDEIFGEVEQVLDGSLIPPDEPISLDQSKSGIQFDIAAVLADRYPQLALKLEDSAQVEIEIPDLPAPETALSRAAEKGKSIDRPQNALSLFERFMIFTGCASAIAALAVWLIAQGMLPKGISALTQKLETATTTASNEAISTASEVDVKFSEYMLRSLAAIDRESATHPKPVQAVAVLPAPIPQPLSSGNRLPLPVPLSQPLQSPASNAASPAPATIQTPVQAQQPTADVVTRREMNQVMNRIVGMLERIAPGVSSRLQLPTSSPPKIASIAKSPGPRAAAKVGVSPVPTASVANVPQRTLTTVLEMGDRSAVLFELNGVTQRIYLGESVGSTGWSLVEVSKDSAILRRNGEVRTLGVGQKL